MLSPEDSVCSIKKKKCSKKLGIVSYPTVSLNNKLQIMRETKNYSGALVDWNVMFHRKCNFMRPKAKILVTRWILILSLCHCISSLQTAHYTTRHIYCWSSVCPEQSFSTYREAMSPFQKLPPRSNAFRIKSNLHQSTKADVQASMEIDPDQLAAAKQSHKIAQTAASRSSEEVHILEKKLTSKVLNAFLLIACFGFVTYSILNVDQGMTRGWSMTEKAMRIPLDNWASYESSLNTQPIATKTTINVIIYLLGDWLSQTVFVKKNVLEFDAARTFKNGFIGLVFGPLVHEYYEFSDMILPVDVGVNRIYKIFMDQTIYLFIKCNIYIVAVNLLAGENLQDSVETAKGKIKGIMFTAWKFWPLVHCITYGAIPARHRILWVNCVDLFWNAILALKTSSNGVEEEGKKNAINGSTEEDESVDHLVNRMENDSIGEITLEAPDKGNALLSQDDRELKRFDEIESKSIEEIIGITAEIPEEKEESVTNKEDKTVTILGDSFEEIGNGPIEGIEKIISKINVEEKLMAENDQIVVSRKKKSFVISSVNETIAAQD